MINLSKEQFKMGDGEEIRRLFTDYLLLDPDSNLQGVCVFKESNFEGYKLFFSPRCIYLKKIRFMMHYYDAEEVDAPSSNKLVFYAGDAKFGQEYLNNL